MIPSSEPAQFFAGDTIKWSLGPNDPIASGEGTQWNMLFTGLGIMRDYVVSGLGLMQDYSPADGWRLHYVLKNVSGSFSFDATTSASGDGYDVSFDTSAVTDGSYLLLGYVDKDTGTERHIVRSRRVLVLPNPASDDPLDFRTDARKIYEKIKSDEARGVIVAEYTIGTLHCRYQTVTERTKALQFWGTRVAREEGKCPAFYGVSWSV